MKFIFAGKNVLAIGLLLLVVSCGSSDTTNATDSLIGRYALNSFTVVTSNQETLTQDNFSSFSVTLILNGNGTFETSGGLNGESTVVTGTWRVLNDSSFSSTSNGCTEISDFAFNNGVLTTTDDDITCSDVISSEIDRWIKL